MNNSATVTIASSLLAILFIVAACLQLNDINPEIYHEASRLDSILWIVFYAFMAALFIARMFAGRVPAYLVIVGVASCIYFMATTIGGVYDNIFNQDQFELTGSRMAPDRSHIELSREFFGALISLLSLIFLWFQRGPSKTDPGEA